MTIQLIAKKLERARTRELDKRIYRALLFAIGLWCVLGAYAFLALAGWVPMPEWAAAAK